jgi:hypothetical protein
MDFLGPDETHLRQDFGENVEFVATLCVHGDEGSECLVKTQLNILK